MPNRQPERYDLLFKVDLTKPILWLELLDKWASKSQVKANINWSCNESTSSIPEHRWEAKLISKL